MASLKKLHVVLELVCVCQCNFSTSLTIDTSIYICQCNFSTSLTGIHSNSKYDIL